MLRSLVIDRVIRVKFLPAKYGNIIFLCCIEKTIEYRKKSNDNGDEQKNVIKFRFSIFDYEFSKHFSFWNM